MSEDLAPAFGEYVNARAREAGYDIDSPRGGGRTQLSADVGMSQASVSRMLAGQTIPDARFAQRLADALGVAVGEILARAGIISSPNALSEASPAPSLTPTMAAARLGISDPEKVAAFKTIVAALRD